MKLATDIRHVSELAEKVFKVRCQRSRVKVKSTAKCTFVAEAYVRRRVVEALLFRRRVLISFVI